MNKHRKRLDSVLKALTKKAKDSFNFEGWLDTIQLESIEILDSAINQNDAVILKPDSISEKNLLVDSL